MSSSFHSASQSCPILAYFLPRAIMALWLLFLQIARFDVFYVRSFHRGHGSGMDKSSSASVCCERGPKSMWLRKYQEEDEEETVIRAIKESEILVSDIFYNFFLFIFSQLLYFIIFFHTIFTPTTHDLCHDICMRIDFRSCAAMPKFAHKIALI